MPPLTTPAPEAPFKAAPLERVRMGFIGVGSQGTSHVKNFLRIDKLVTGKISVVPGGTTPFLLAFSQD